MSLDNYLRAVRVHDSESAREIRRAFVSARIDERGQAALGLGDDLSEPCSGYLFDHVQPRELIDESVVLHRLGEFETVFLMWELPIPGPVPMITSRVAVDSILEASADILLAGQQWLPEDLYLFDSSQKWAAALTHEWLDSGRYCLWSE